MPGHLLVGTLKGVGKVYLHTVVDAFCSYAFGFLHTSKQPEAAAAVNLRGVARIQLAVNSESTLTDNQRQEQVLYSFVAARQLLCG